MKVMAEIAYDGRAYHGWQVQKNAPSVQSTLQFAAQEMLSAPCAVTGCSRTDAGVHARRYICTLESGALDAFPLDRLPAALNRLLPPDISVKTACTAPDGFHARYSAIAKEYEYLISLREPRDPFFAWRAYNRPGARPDLSLMRREAAALVGEHDFSSFCAAGGKPGDRVRTVYFCTVGEEKGIISLRVCADGFLYNMVRIIAGTLLERGEGRGISVEDALKGKNRSAAGRTAPPGGLYLDRVYYDREELNERMARL